MDNRKDIDALDIFADHYVKCEQCREAFITLHDSGYCEIGMPLFKAWQETPAGDLTREIERDRNSQ